MPRYSYSCDSCKSVSELFHLIAETPDTCPVCESSGTLQKMVSKPIIRTSPTEAPLAVKDKVDGHIDAARQDLDEQKRELKKEELIKNDNNN